MYVFIIDHLMLQVSGDIPCNKGILITDLSINYYAQLNALSVFALVLSWMAPQQVP